MNKDDTIPRLTSMQIKNYKSLVSVSVDFEPLTILVGPNGSGKSNLMDALAFVQESVDESVAVAFRRRGSLLRVLSRHERRPTIEPPSPLPEDPNQMESILDSAIGKVAAIGFRFNIKLSAHVRAAYAFEIALVGYAGGFVVSRESCSVENDNGEKSSYHCRNGRFLYPIEGVPAQLPYDHLALVGAASNEAFRPVYEFLRSMRLYNISPNTLRESQQPDLGLYLKRDCSNATSVLKNYRSLHPDEEGPYARLISTMSRVIEGLVSIEEFSEGSKEKIMVWQDLGLGDPIPFDTLNISDGSLRVLGLLLAIYQRQKAASIVGIEEPELTVHPGLAEIITETLIDATSDRQIISTTHSPDILDYKELTDNQIRVVGWENGRTYVAPISAADREILRKRLYSPGELLRFGELDGDQDFAERRAAEVNLFAEPLAVGM